MAAESKSIRISDAADPDRQDKFDAVCRAHNINGNGMLRSLVDALLLYIREHGHPPKVPMRLAPFEPEKKKR